MDHSVVKLSPAADSALGTEQHIENPDEWPRAISGSPDTLADVLEQLADRVGVDEVMIQHAVADHEDALRSHELLADGIGLTPD